MTFEVLLHRFAFVTLIISLFMLSKICLLIIPISDFVGFMSLHLGLIMKSGLWSFNVMNASLLAETYIYIYIYIYIYTPVNKKTAILRYICLLFSHQKGRIGGMTISS